MEKTMINDLTTGSVGKELLRFSFPFMLSNALQTVYNLVDMVVVGQFVGSAGLTAVSLGGQITWLLSCLAIGYASGGSDFTTKNTPANRDNPFGGGAGGSVKITPIAFLVIRDGNVRMLPVAEPASTSMDRLVEQLPDILDRVDGWLSERKEKGPAGN